MVLSISFPHRALSLSLSLSLLSFSLSLSVTACLHFLLSRRTALRVVGDERASSSSSTRAAGTHTTSERGTIKEGEEEEEEGEHDGDYARPCSRQPGGIGRGSKVVLLPSTNSLPLLLFFFDEFPRFSFWVPKVGLIFFRGNPGMSGG
jgi:hypothetical protein